VTIRRARESDAPSIAAIYNQAMKDGVFATCDVTPVTAESRLAWLAAHVEPFPAFVFERCDAVVGWSALNRFSIRPSYPSIAEVSVYVGEDHRNNVVGAALFVHLLVTAQTLGLRSLVSLTFEKNRPSIRGLIAGGFEPKAALQQVAWLRGRWENVIWLQRDLTGDVLAGVSPGLRALGRSGRLDEEATEPRAR
jgi:phosphinothricin acetyltransferase